MSPHPAHPLFELCIWLISLLVASHLWFFFRVLQPARRLAAQAEALAQGDFDSIALTSGGIAEVQALQRSLASMAAHVRRAQAQGRAYSSQLATAQEAERGRLARELHDDTVQSLIAAAQSLDLIRALPSPELSAARLAQTREALMNSADHLRDLIADLRPPALDELGLLPALEMHLAKRPTPTLPIHLRATGEVRRLPDAYELTLYRAAQEALSNIERHSRAQTATFTVDYLPDRVRLTAQDDGIGFAVSPSALDQLAREGHFGLLGLRERAQSLDGTLKVTSAPGAGTRLTIELPLVAVEGPGDSVRDPVCDALIHPQQAYGSTVYGTKTYYFCCPVCQGAFNRDPEFYLGSPDAL
jgi:signal transduction histidine kinase/YHS domain-containing protein